MNGEEAGERNGKNRSNESVAFGGKKTIAIECPTEDVVAPAHPRQLIRDEGEDLCGVMERKSSVVRLDNGL